MSSQFTRKLVSFISSFSLLLQTFSPFMYVVPSRVFSSEPLHSRITYNKEKGAFTLVLNTKENNVTSGKIAYSLVYKNDLSTNPEQLENVKKTADLTSEDFTVEIDAKTCSSENKCVNHDVSRGIMKVKIDDASWYDAEWFTLTGASVSEFKTVDTGDFEMLFPDEEYWLKTGKELIKLEVPTPTITPSPTPILLPTQVYQNILTQVMPSATVVPSSPTAVPATGNELITAEIVKTDGSYADPALVPTTWTDKADYAPTEKVIVSGKNFTPDYIYTISISSQDDPAVTHTGSFTALSDGTFTYEYQLDGNYRPNYAVQITDNSGVIIAQTIFTDSLSGVKVISGSQTPNPVGRSSSTTFTANVINTSGSTARRVSITSASGLPSGASFNSSQCLSIPGDGASHPITFTINTNSSVTTGSTTFSITATRWSSTTSCAGTGTGYGTMTSSGSNNGLLIIDSTSPTAAITYSKNTVKSGDSLIITATFNENMASSPAPKITIFGANAVSATDMTRSDATHYTYIHSVGAGNGSATVSMSVGKDLSGNVVTSTPTSGATFTVDNTAPTVRINQAAGQTDPTTTSPVNFTVVFSESVSDFATGDVTVTGTAGGTKAATVTGSGTTYNVAVTGMTAQGTVIASIGAGVAHDAAGNSNIASTSTDHTVTWGDSIAPTLTSRHIGSNTTHPSFAKTGDLVVLEFTASEAIQTPTITIAGHAATVTNTGGNSWSGSYTMTSGDTEGTVPFTINFSDIAGNVGTQVTTTTDSTSVTFDKTAPTCPTPTIASVSGSPYISGSTVYYNTNVYATGSFKVTEGASDTNGIQKVSFGAATSSPADDSTNPYEGTYSWTSGSTFDGTATVTCFDTAGNTATSTFTIHKDVTYPAVNSITLDKYFVKDGTTVNITSNITETGSGISSCHAWWSNTSNFSGSYSDLGNLGVGCNGSVTVPSGAGTFYILIASSYLGLGDNVGNFQTSNLASSAVLVDNTAPTTSDDTGFGGQTYFSTKTFTLTPNDHSGSGVANTKYCVADYPDTCTPDTVGTSVTVTCPGVASCTKWIFYQSTDNAGNVEASGMHSYNFNIVNDTTPPTTINDIDGNWHKSAVTVNLTCTDNSGGMGCDKIYYTTDGSTPTTSSLNGNTFTLSDEGTYVIKYFSVDKGDNAESVKTASNQVKIDKTNPADPTVSSTSHSESTWSNDNTIDMTWSGASDSLSGVAGYSYLYDTSSTTEPDHVSEGTGTSTTSSAFADGDSYYFHLATVDTAGNWTSTVHKGPFYIDKTAPTYTWTSPDVDSVYADGQTIEVDATVADSGSGILDGVNCNPAIHTPVGYFTGGVTYNASTGKCTGTLTLITPSNLPDGVHHVTLTVTDVAGNSVTSSDRNILIDNTAPTVSLVDSDGDTYTVSTSTPHEIKVTFSENIANTPTITVNGTGQTVNNCSDANDTTFCFDYSIPSVTDYSTVTIAVSGATDMVGNVMTTNSSHTFVVDTLSPTVTIINPNISPAQSKTITASVLGGVLTMSNITGSVCDGDSDLIFAAYADQTFVSESDNGIKVCYRTQDSVGNTTYSMSDAIGGIDKTAPVIASHADVTAEATSSFGATVVYTSPSTSDTVDGSGTAVCTPASGSTFTIGTTVVTCNATDSAGNDATPTTFSVIVEDTTGPTVSLTSPSVGANLKGTVTLEANATDAVGVTKVEFWHATVGSKIGNGTEVSSGVYSINWDTTFVADGNHDLWVVGYDAAGNHTVSTYITIKVDNTAPSKPTADPAAGDYTSDQSVTLTSSDTGSGLKYIYFTIDGSTPNASKTLYEGSISVDHDMTIKAIAYDKAGNASDVLEATYGVPPKISNESSVSSTFTTATITWLTDDPSTSRVVYDTVSHATLGSAPNYGYANSTVEDGSKVTSHSVGLTGLTTGTTYYYRVISHGSPEAIGAEKSFSITCTAAKPTAPGSLTLTRVNDTEVKVSWSAAPNPVTGYKVTWSKDTDTDGEGDGSRTVGNVLETSISGLELNKYGYYFKVFSINECSTGDANGIQFIGAGSDLRSSSTTSTSSSSSVATVLGTTTGGVFGQEEVAGAETNSLTPTPVLSTSSSSEGSVGQVEGVKTEAQKNLIALFFIWIITHKKITLGILALLVLFIFLLWRRKKKNKVEVK